KENRTFFKRRGSACLEAASSALPEAKRRLAACGETSWTVATKTRRHQVFHQGDNGLWQGVSLPCPSYASPSFFRDAKIFNRLCTAHSKRHIAADSVADGGGS